MPAFLLSMLGVGKVIAQGCVQWLSKRSLAEIACIILGVACAILIAANKAEKRHSAKLQAQVVSLDAELAKLSTAKNEQQVVTRDNIKVVTKLVHDADGKAKVVEQAPVPGGCVTKPEVMNADV
jgi:hypothetical protein